MDIQWSVLGSHEYLTFGFTIQQACIFIDVTKYVAFDNTLLIIVMFKLF